MRKQSAHREEGHSLLTLCREREVQGVGVERGVCGVGGGGGWRGECVCVCVGGGGSCSFIVIQCSINRSRQLAAHRSAHNLPSGRDTRRTPQDMCMVVRTCVWL